MDQGRERVRERRAEGRGHVSEGAGANMNDMTSAVLCDKGVVGGYRREVVVGKSCASEIGGSDRRCRVVAVVGCRSRIGSERVVGGPRSIRTASTSMLDNKGVIGGSDRRSARDNW